MDPLKHYTLQACLITEDLLIIDVLGCFLILESKRAF